MSLDIIIIAVIAFVILFRLWTVLGQRTGYENDMQDGFFVEDIEDSKTKNQTNAHLEKGEGIEAVMRADPSFHKLQFLEGARSAFGDILAAFYEGRKQDLKPLLSPSVYKTFSEAIDQGVNRDVEDFSLEIADSEIKKSLFEGHNAYITVRFRSKQIVKQKSGERVSREPIDLWTFTRNVLSKNPNWILVETAAEA